MAKHHQSRIPCCQTPGCTELVAVSKYYYDEDGNFTGWGQYRKWCIKCHNARTAARHGVSTIAEVVAKNAGFASVLAYTHSKHPYLWNRKTYCENIDGRLGFKCTTTIVWDGMLDVDHVNGDPSDNDEANHQTLCKCCHAYKTNKEKDYMTPGRKALGIKC